MLEFKLQKTLLKTKIVCSMGPATENDEVLTKIIQNGMNIARFNFSHGNHDYHKNQMERVRKLSEKCNKTVALMMDTKGPEIRTGDTFDGNPVKINKGDVVIVKVDGSKTKAAVSSTPAEISLNWSELVSKAFVGLKILIADGLLELDVEKVEESSLLCVAANSAIIGSKKNCNLIGLHANLPIVSEQDKKDIAFSAKMDCDFVAASFVSFASEVHEIRRYLESLGSKMKIIAKIENEEGLNNIAEIVEAADGIMIARGDLGVQLSIEQIPLAQKFIISECRKQGKPVITATQMLDSMICNPRPTRAELTDVANAIFDGTDAVMLSGETANGSYPESAVETMARIAESVEQSVEYKQKMKSSYSKEENPTIGQSMAYIAYIASENISASAILVPTLSGHTATMISRFRPSQAIIAVTPDKRIQRQLMLNWGIIPLYLEKNPDDSEEMIQYAAKSTLDSGFIKTSEKVILCAGIPLQSPIPVNTIRVLIIGNVLARGRNGGFPEEKSKISGRIVKAKTPQEAVNSLRHKKGEILLCPTIDEDWIPILRIVDGVIVTGQNEILPEMLQNINKNLIWIEETGNHERCMENGLTVTIDAKDLLVYEGWI